MFFNFENRIPSHDTYNRVINCVEAIKLENCFRGWGNSIIENKGIQGVINFDRIRIKGGKVSVLYAKCLVLLNQHGFRSFTCQWKIKRNNVYSKINRTLRNSKFHYNHCQTAIAEKIIEKNSQYVLGLKGNQPKLLEEIEDEFRFAKDLLYCETFDLDHGRIDTRKCR